jgi:hypothetical protein
MATVQYARASSTWYAGLVLHVLVRVKGDVRKMDVLSPIQLRVPRRRFTARGWHASSWVSDNDCYAALGTFKRFRRPGDELSKCAYFGHIVSNIQAYTRGGGTYMLQWARNFFEDISCLTSEHSLITAPGSQLYIRVSGARLMASSPCANPTLYHRPMSLWWASVGQELSGILMICSSISTKPRAASRPRVSVL